MNRNNRIQHIDTARGIAIICIILGHLGNMDINRFVFTFHVPLFFLLSGYFYNKEINARTLVIKRVRTLLIPYVICCTLIILSAVFINQLTNQGTGDKDIILYWLQASAYGAGDNYTTPFVIHQIGAIWFLLALFWTGLAFFAILKLKSVIRPFAVFAFFFLMKATTKLFWFPASIQASGPALLYMYVGFIVKENEEAIRRIPKEIKAFAALAALGIWTEFIAGFKGYWLVHCHMGRGAIDFIGSLCGCWWILMLAKYLIQKIPGISTLLGYLGRYSLLVLCAHLIELNTFPWNSMIQGIFPQLSEKTVWYTMITGKLLWSIIFAVLLSKWKVTRMLFGYNRKQKVLRR